MRPSDMTCQELVEIVTAYLEGTLPAIEQASLEAHLAVCEGCRTYLDQMRQTIAVVGTLSEERLSANDRDRLLNLFRSWRQATS
jgi:predicted anti-sigma-YlaC factor YlaD